MSHPELSQTDPLYWFLLMLFGVAPDTPCGLMCLGADGHQSRVSPDAVSGNHNGYNRSLSSTETLEGCQSEPSSVDVLWNSVQLSKTCRLQSQTSSCQAEPQGERPGLQPCQQKPFLEADSEMVVAVLLHKRTERSLYSLAGVAGT